QIHGNRSRTYLGRTGQARRVQLLAAPVGFPRLSAWRLLVFSSSPPATRAGGRIDVSRAPSGLEWEVNALGEAGSKGQEPPRTPSPVRRGFGTRPCESGRPRRIPRSTPSDA